MKLVEILARELEVWPEFASWATQHEKTGEINFDADHGCSASADFSAGVAEDAAYAAVTRPQWQAERDRMKAMEEISKFSQEQDQLQHPVSPTYEQQLWDRVAYRAWELGANDCRELDYVILGCAIVADAFMAERAKRIKGE